MFFPGRVGASATRKSSGDIVNFLIRCTERNWTSNSVNDFSNFLFSSTSSFGAFTLRTGSSDRTFTSFFSCHTTIIITASSVSSSRAFSVFGKVISITLGISWCGGRRSNKFAKVGLDKFFYFIF